MDTNPKPWRRVLHTGVVVLMAVLAASALWWHYVLSPWTRDGRVRVQVVDVAAQIAGQVVDLQVADNQFVRKGDVLFVVDPKYYSLKLTEAETTVQRRLAELTLRQQDLERRTKLGAGAISEEDKQTAESTLEVAKSVYLEAQAARDVAKLNMDRTTVRSPANGYVTHLLLQVGDYATPGETKLSIINSDTFWIAGYFQETKLPRIHVGDYARVQLMGIQTVIDGHVESVSRGISDPDAAASGLGLADVDPVFPCARLAQRIPVRIHIAHVPDELVLSAGMMCTIVV